MLHISLKIERNVYLLNTVLLHYCPDLQPGLADLCFIYNANLNSCLMRTHHQDVDLQHSHPSLKAAEPHLNPSVTTHLP